MRRALLFKQSMPVASAPRALTEPLAGSPCPTNSWQALLMCFLIYLLLLPLQKFEDGWICILEKLENLSAATFWIWCLFLKCSGLSTLKFLSLINFFSWRSFLPRNPTSLKPSWIERPQGESITLTKCFPLFLIARGTTVISLWHPNIKHRQHMLLHLFLFSILLISPFKYIVCLSILPIYP